MGLLKQLQRIIGFALRTPTRIANHIDGRRKRQSCILMTGAVLFPQSRVTNNQPREHIVIGSNSRVLAKLETFGHGGRIEIGERCYVGEDTRIWSASSVKIGDRVLISHGVNIHDTNAHSLTASRRAEHFNAIFDGGGHPKSLPDVSTQPIVIGNDVWIGFGSTILKGVTIGDGAVVGAGSFVTKDVEPFTIVVGNPARFIREIAHEP
jgi:acetyltransferase-like isoleucine patch superfamily enzyme